MWLEKGLNSLSIIVSFSFFKHPVCPHFFEPFVHKSAHSIVVFIRFVPKSKYLKIQTKMLLSDQYDSEFILLKQLQAVI